MTVRTLSFFWLSCLAMPIPAADEAPHIFQAGAAMVDITPIVFPVLVNGMVEERTATTAHDVLMSRWYWMTEKNASPLSLSTASC